MLEKKWKMDQELSDIIIEEEEQFVDAITNVHIDLVYLETKLGLSFNSHPLMVDLLRRYGIDTGQSCNTREAATEITVSNSEFIRKNLNEYLKADDSPLALVLGRTISVYSVVVDKTEFIGIYIGSIVFDNIQDFD